MKRIYLFALILIAACQKDRLEIDTQGVLTPNKLGQTVEGLESLLIGTYAMLDGFDGQDSGRPSYYVSGSNWLLSDVASDDSHIGAEPGICCFNNPEFYQLNGDEDYLYGKWKAVYEGIARANSTLQVIASSPLPPSTLRPLKAEARFLRGHFYFELKKIWNRVPLITEKTDDFRAPNRGTTELRWSHIEEDFKFAFAHLPRSQALPGRARRRAALAYLAKTRMYQQDWNGAKPLLDEIIDSRQYQLMPNFQENFELESENGPEAIFQIQMSYYDGTSIGQNGNFGDLLNFPHGAGIGSCCGFNQPTQNLVNAFRTDQEGLPYLDSFNAQDVHNDQGLASDDPFTPSNERLDPRLDWTVGRRGIPYWDWGIHGGADWIRNQAYGGPYSPKKNVYKLSDKPNGNVGWANGTNAKNWNLIRFADVLLWRAEVAVEENDLVLAVQLVNKIRKRAKNSQPVVIEENTPAANYQIGLYRFFPDQAYARKAVRFERRLELAMEGHRFFDLVRWEMAEEVLNEYLDNEQEKRTYLSRSTFDASVDQYYPLPNQAIRESLVKGNPTLVQNPGY